MLDAPDMPDVLLGTTGGVRRLRGGSAEPLGLQGERIAALHAGPEGVVLAGSYGGGLFRSEDRGESWARVEEGPREPTLRFLADDPSRPGALLAGTEPARVFRSEDAGASWFELDGLGRIDGHDRWFLPYSPRAGAARNVHGGPGRLLVSIEVGGLADSRDGGESWTCEPVLGDEDVHEVSGHPSDPEVVYVALGTASLARDGRRHGGIARSRDGGATWERIETRYTRSVMVPPARADLVVACPAGRVGREGSIVVSDDGGDTWRPAGDGLEAPLEDMVERFVAAPDGSVWAICARGRVVRAEPGTWSWSQVPGSERLTVESVAFAG
jgi:photosystem II stability/assembly factor-like uncharacterized protein